MMKTTADQPFLPFFPLSICHPSYCALPQSGHFFCLPRSGTSPNILVNLRESGDGRESGVGGFQAGGTELHSGLELLGLVFHLDEAGQRQRLPLRLTGGQVQGQLQIFGAENRIKFSSKGEEPLRGRQLWI